ncbi:MAG: DUF2335 domain-containing protein [Gammaproteobacteria bacterium]|nr:DUF2335 domain-containing protein [Gammaproteobacteria bacterium]MDE0514570.1 DUF2335 domain-containing protein [Gammaproteobacteria bacterium]
MRQKSKSEHPDQPQFRDKQGLVIPGSHTGKELDDFVKNLTDEQREQLVQKLFVGHRTESIFIGPLPSPEDFNKYNQVVPDAAERILSMAEKEQQIRFEGQTKALANDSKRINRSTITYLALVAVAGVAAWKGFVAIAVPLGLAGVIASIIRLLNDWFYQSSSSKK